MSLNHISPIVFLPVRKTLSTIIAEILIVAVFVLADYFQVVTFALRADGDLFGAFVPIIFLVTDTAILTEPLTVRAYVALVRFFGIVVLVCHALPPAAHPLLFCPSSPAIMLLRRSKEVEEPPPECPPVPIEVFPHSLLP
jgi:hypothetical protein